MTIFTKTKIVKILTDKINSGEIKGFHLTESYLRVTKSKRTGFTFKLVDFTDNQLTRILVKQTPNPSIQNINDFYIKQIQRYK